MSSVYDAPRKRTRAEGRGTNPISEVFEKNEQYTLPRIQMQDALYHYVTDIDVKMASTAKLNYAFGAGIQLERTNYELNSKKAETFSKRCKSISKEMWKYLWSINFCAVVIDEEAARNEDPLPYLVLEVEKLEVKYFRDPMGRKWFNYFLPGGGSDVISKEIHNVITFFLDGDFLDNCGNICSLITSLMPEVKDVTSKRMNTMVADWGRANPLLVTEKPMPKNDPENISALPELYEPQGAIALGDKSTVTSGTINNGGNMWQARITPSELAGQKSGGSKSNTARTDQYDHVLDLAEGRTLANPQIPEAPLNTLETAAQKKENVFMLFQVPLSMISNASSGSTMKAASGNAGGKKSEGQQSSSAKELFYSGLAEMKNFSIGILEKMLNHYYMREHVEQVKADNKKDGKEGKSMKEIGEQAYIKVNIPGRADMDTIMQFYYLGMIKPEFIMKTASPLYFIPNEAWLPTPALSALEINGMQPPEPKTATASK